MKISRYNSFSNLFYFDFFSTWKKLKKFKVVFSLFSKVKTTNC